MSRSSFSYAIAPVYLSGSGSANSIAEWGASGSLGSSRIFDTDVDIEASLSTSQYFRINNTAGTGVSGYQLSVSGTNVGVFSANSNGEVRLGSIFANSFLTLYSGNSEFLRATTSGFVGLNKTNPLSRFHIGDGDLQLDSTFGVIISGSNTTGNVLRANGTKFISSQLQYSDLGGTPSIPTVTGTVNFVSKFSGANAVGNSSVFDNGTNIGIFNSSPATSIHIGSNTAPQQVIRLNNTGSASPVYSLFRAGVAESVMWVGASPTSPIQFAINPASYTDAALTTATKFAIGTTFIDISTSGYGAKLPISPGNADSQTLDAYNEKTRAVTSGTSGWTYVTCNQYWTLVGRKVTLHTIFTGGTSSATAGATIPTPPGLTPVRIAAGTAVNSAGTALGNAVCVATTSGTILTSNTITSSAVDKVLSVTYEII